MKLPGDDHKWAYLSRINVVDNPTNQSFIDAPTKFMGLELFTRNTGECLIINWISKHMRLWDLTVKYLRSFKQTKHLLKLNLFVYRILQILVRKPHTFWVRFFFFFFFFCYYFCSCFCWLCADKYDLKVLRCGQSVAYLSNIQFFNINLVFVVFFFFLISDWIFNDVSRCDWNCKEMITHIM